MVASGKPDRGGSDETTVRMKVSDRVADDEQCFLPRSTLNAVGVELGAQIRLICDGSPAVFTTAVSDDKFGYLSAGGQDRLGAKGGSFKTDVSGMVVNPTLDEETAAAEGGFFEHLVDTGSTDLVALAPHGGYIEWGTDKQVARVSEQLGSSGWYSSGWWPGGGAYSRWHITSTDIDPSSFPELATITDRGFDHAVSFHGWSESHIAIGGAAPTTLREDVRDAIADVADCAVRLSATESLDGDSPENIVNWITESGTDGVQIEQPWSVRDNYPLVVADAVADVFANR